MKKNGVTRSLDVRLIRTYNHLHVFTRFLGATPLSEVFGVEDPCNGPSNVLSPLSSPIVFIVLMLGSGSEDPASSPFFLNNREEFTDYDYWWTE